MAKIILIVEDNEINMKLFSDVLNAQGYHVLQAYSGLAALQLAAEHQPDLLVLDIQLPDMSGLEVAQRVLKDNPRPPVIVAVTAFAMNGDAESFLNSGCDVYIPKPIEVMKFIATIRDLLGE